MKKFIFLIVLTATLLVFPLTVLAEDSTGNSGRGNSELQFKDRLKEKLEEREERIASRAALKKEKLGDIKQRVCEVKARNIVRRSEKLAKRADNQLKVFSSIADRVDKYYTTKLVPKGITVASYSALKADIADKKAEVKVSVDAATSSAKAFDCKGDDPKGQLTNFREDMKDVIGALKDYRTSIKNFIVAVKGVLGQSKTATTSAD